MLRSALVIARRILRQRLRDRSAILFAVLTPLGLAVAFAAIIPDFSPTFHTTILVVDRDGGRLGAASSGPRSSGSVAESGIADIATAADEAAATAEIERRPGGRRHRHPGRLHRRGRCRGEPAEIRILAGGDTDRPRGRASRRHRASRPTSAPSSSPSGRSPRPAARPTRRPSTRPRRADPRLESDRGRPTPAAEKRQASMATFYGAAMAIMFVFFATQYGALALLASGATGRSNRLLAAPVAPAAIVLGGALAGMVLGLVAMTTLVVATTLLVHASWGPPVLLAALLLAGRHRRDRRSRPSSRRWPRPSNRPAGSTRSSPLCLAAIGGVFIPLSQAPELLGADRADHAARVVPARHRHDVGRRSSPSPRSCRRSSCSSSMGLVTGAIGLARARRALVPA